MSNGYTIVRDFVHTLGSAPRLSVRHSLLSRNVVDVTGRINCLLYVKGRGAAPYRWGVTANVVTGLYRQSRQWFVVLLHETAATGYLLTPRQVAHNIANVWPLAKDGDYKPSPGTYLEASTTFSSFKEFLCKVRAAT